MNTPINVQAVVGNARDKTIKNHLASMLIYESMAGQRGSGVLRVDAERGTA